MELIVFVLLVVMLGAATSVKWGGDSTPAMPDGHRQQGL